MYNYLTDWLRHKTRAGDKRRPPPCPPVPEPLTPRSSEAYLVATSSSTFFTALPYEIRRYILILAFGDRPVHVDLRLEHPLKPESRRFYRCDGADASAHGSSPQHDHHAARPHANIPRAADLDFTKPPHWQWRSAVCHRPCFSWRAAPGTQPSGAEPLRDVCQEEISQACAAWPGPQPHRCQLGALGWLLTCYRAYVEGVEVLYATNRMHIDGPWLLGCLPTLWPRHGLAAVRSTELLWRIFPWKEATWREEDEFGAWKLVGLDSFSTLVAALPDTLPGLRYLHLTLRGEVVPRDGAAAWDVDEIHDKMETLLRIIDAALLAMPALMHTRIAVPQSALLPWSAKLPADAVTMGQDGRPLRVWRELRSGPTGELSTNTMQCHGGSGLEGYWVFVGEKDMRTILEG